MVFLTSPKLKNEEIIGDPSGPSTEVKLILKKSTTNWFQVVLSKWLLSWSLHLEKNLVPSGYNKDTNTLAAAETKQRGTQILQLNMIVITTQSQLTGTGLTGQLLAINRKVEGFWLANELASL